jgi:O-antigen ligase
MNWKSIFRKPSVLLTLLLAASLPLFQTAVPIIIGLLLIFSIGKWDWKSRFECVKQSPAIIALLGFYLFNVVGLIGTENIDKGLNHLEIKLSFLLLPWLIFANTDLTTKWRTLIKQTFVVSCFAFCMYLVSRASFVFVNTSQNEFTYELFSHGFHPSYLALYLLLASRICYAEIQHSPSNQVFKNLFLITVFVCCIVLLSSKINLLILGVSLLYFFISAIIRAKSRTNLLLIASAFVGIIVLTVFYNPGIRERAERSIQVFSHAQTIEKSDIESNAARILIWQSAWTLLKENPMGLGVGDVNIELEKQYKKDGFTGIESKKLNAHNQFLQTGVALGFPGLILLLFVFILPFITLKKQQNGILFYFLIVCFANALVEGILETQKGVVFFGFFYCLLLRDDERD